MHMVSRSGWFRTAPFKALHPSLHFCGESLATLQAMMFAIILSHTSLIKLQPFDTACTLAVNNISHSNATSNETFVFCKVGLLHPIMFLDFQDYPRYEDHREKFKININFNTADGGQQLTKLGQLALSVISFAVYSG